MAVDSKLIQSVQASNAASVCGGTSTDVSQQDAACVAEENQRIQDVFTQTPNIDNPTTLNWVLEALRVYRQGWAERFASSATGAPISDQFDARGRVIKKGVTNPASTGLRKKMRDAEIASRTSATPYAALLEYVGAPSLCPAASLKEGGRCLEKLPSGEWHKKFIQVAQAGGQVIEGTTGSAYIVPKSIRGKMGDWSDGLNKPFVRLYRLAVDLSHDATLASKARDVLASLTTIDKPVSATIDPKALLVDGEVKVVQIPAKVIEGLTKPEEIAAYRQIFEQAVVNYFNNPAVKMKIVELKAATTRGDDAAKAAAARAVTEFFTAATAALAATSRTAADKLVAPAPAVKQAELEKMSVSGVTLNASTKFPLEVVLAKDANQMPVGLTDPMGNLSQGDRDVYLHLWLRALQANTGSGGANPYTTPATMTTLVQSYLQGFGALLFNGTGAGQSFSASIAASGGKITVTPIDEYVVNELKKFDLLPARLPALIKQVRDKGVTPAQANDDQVGAAIVAAMNKWLAEQRAAATAGTYDGDASTRDLTALDDVTIKDANVAGSGALTITLELKAAAGGKAEPSLVSVIVDTGVARFTNGIYGGDIALIVDGKAPVTDSKNVTVGGNAVVVYASYPDQFVAPNTLAVSDADPGAGRLGKLAGAAITAAASTEYGKYQLNLGVVGLKPKTQAGASQMGPFAISPEGGFAAGSGTGVRADGSGDVGPVHLEGNIHLVKRSPNTIFGGDSEKGATGAWDFFPEDNPNEFGFGATADWKIVGGLHLANTFFGQLPYGGKKSDPLSTLGASPAIYYEKIPLGSAGELTPGVGFTYTSQDGTGTVPGQRALGVQAAWKTPWADVVVTPSFHSYTNDGEHKLGDVVDDKGQGCDRVCLDPATGTQAGSGEIAFPTNSGGKQLGVAAALPVSLFGDVDATVTGGFYRLWTETPQPESLFNSEPDGGAERAINAFLLRLTLVHK